MAKYCGKVGFVRTMETSPGIWEAVATERTYYGDVLRNTRRWEPREQLNDNLSLNNMISIVCKDSYLVHNTSAIRYIWWKGSQWEVTNIEIQYPRLILTIGGIYNGFGEDEDSGISGGIDRE